jgi:hypothetical protein
MHKKEDEIVKDNLHSQNNGLFSGKVYFVPELF